MNPRVQSPVLGRGGRGKGRKGGDGRQERDERRRKRTGDDCGSLVQTLCIHRVTDNLGRLGKLWQGLAVSPRLV